MSELHIKFGELLKLEREHQGITLADVSEALKIAEETLVNIEAGDTEALPSELYFRMFTKSYAEHLGIDYPRTVEAICEELGVPLEPDARKDTATRPKRDPDHTSETGADSDEEDTASRGNVRKLVILAVVVVGGFAIFLLAFQLFFAGDPDQTPAETTATETATAAEADRKVSADADYNWDVPTYEAPDSITLSLTAGQESWATVLRDGDTALYQTLTANRPYTLKAKYRFRVSVAIPRVVDITIDGQPAYLARTGSGRISRVEIDQTNRDRFSSPPEPVTPVKATATNTTEAADTADSSLQEGSDNI